MVYALRWLIYILKRGNRSSVEVTWGRAHICLQVAFPLFKQQEAEYEALVVGLKAAKNLGMKRLKVFGDSELVIKQIEGAYRVKNPSLFAYRATV